VSVQLGYSRSIASLGFFSFLGILVVLHHFPRLFFHRRLSGACIIIIFNLSQHTPLILESSRQRWIIIHDEVTKLAKCNPLQGLCEEICYCFARGTVLNIHFFTFYSVSHKKYLMSMCWVRLLLKPRPIFSRRMELWLSC
jgi:hypothetical protein